MGGLPFCLLDLGVPAFVKLFRLLGGLISLLTRGLSVGPVKVGGLRGVLVDRFSIEACSSSLDLDRVFTGSVTILIGRVVLVLVV